MGRRLTLALTLAIALGLAISGQATAKTITPYTYSGTSFDGAGSTAGAFADVDKIVIDHATGAVYVLDRGVTSSGGSVIVPGVVSRFDSSGTPLPFSAPSLGGASSIVLGQIGRNRGPDIAVDNSGTASQSNVYILQDRPPSGGVEAGSLLHAFDASGARLPGRWPLCGANCGRVGEWGDQAQGVAVGPDGTIWVSAPPSRYAPSTAPDLIAPFDVNGERSIGRERIWLSALRVATTGVSGLVPGSFAYDPMRLDLDAEGNFYLYSRLLHGSSSGNGAIIKVDADGSPQILPFAGAATNNNIIVDLPTEVEVDRSTNRVFVDQGNRVEVFSPDGELTASFGQADGPYPGLLNSRGVAVNEVTGNVYVTNTRSPQSVDVFSPGAPVGVPNAATDPPSPIGPSSATLRGTVDPDGHGATTICRFEWGSTPQLGNVTTCSEGNVLASGGGPQQVSVDLAGLNCEVPGSEFCGLSFLPLSKGRLWYYRVATSNASGHLQSGKIRFFRVADPPAIEGVAVDKVGTDQARVGFTLDAEGVDTSYWIEIGEDTEYGTQYPAEPRILGLNSGYAHSGTLPVGPRALNIDLTGLKADTAYHYRVVAENHRGKVFGPPLKFTTFAESSQPPSCPNKLSRQQTGASHLTDCRAFELVSAADTGGYNVTSDLVAGQAPYAGYPEAGDRALYSVVDGGIPGTGNPTNRGADPYVATRGENGWQTRYVGLPADGPSTELFSSTLAEATSDLGSFAFGGPEICDPCFAEGSKGIPLREADGDLVQGMAGSIAVVDPESAEGAVAEHFSSDGSHFVFASTDRFEPLGTDNGTDVTIYDRDLSAGTTRVVSTLPGGTAMQSPGTTQLAISADGSRVIVATPVSTDAEGNRYLHPYMHVGSSPNTIDLAPGTTSGVIWGGMSAEGSEAYFSTPDSLHLSDTDTSADLYRVDVSSTTATPVPVTTTDSDACDPVANADGADWNAVTGGPDCAAVAIGGGGGVASESGAIYFLSPEQLDGPEGTLNEPNLYLAEPGSPPQLLATLEPNNPLVRNSVADSQLRKTTDFQTTPDAGHAAFTTELSFEGYENRGFSQVLYFDASTDQIQCASCPLTEAPSTGDAGLASNGLSLSDDGRLFFNARDRLVLTDSNERQDAYQYSDGVATLVSTGLSQQDSSIHSVSRDGTDAFFFTRQKLVPQDQEATVVKLYVARENGGFFVIPPPKDCAASDECHGPSSPVAAPAPIRTVGSSAGQTGQTKPRRCAKGKVRRGKRCIKRQQSKQRKSKRSKRALAHEAGSGRGGSR